MASRRRDRVPPPEVKTWQACAALGGQQREGGMHVEREQREHLTCARISDQPRPQVASYRASCASCGTRVWVAISSPIELMRLCLQCAEVEQAGSSRQKITL